MTTHRRNHLEPAQIWLFIGLSTVLLAHVGFGFANNGLYLFGRAGVIHLTGHALWAVVAAGVLGASSLILLVIAHFDHTSPEKIYRKFTTSTAVGAWVFLVLAAVLESKPWPWY